MYWFRTSPSGELLAWLLLSSLWWLGGWLLSSHAFRLRPRERLVAGLGLGLLLFITFSNLAAIFLPLTPAYWGGAAAVLLAGGLAAWRSLQRPVLDRADLQAWPQLLALLGLTLLFGLINRGLAIFDDYHNLPLVSTMAAGDVPPHYFLNPDTRLAFHYGLHLFAAGLVRLGGFAVWSAFDLVKAFTLGLSAVVAWLWFSRVTRSGAGGFWGSLLALLGGGARWLLIIVPAGLLSIWSRELQLLGSAAQSGSDLSALLLSAWRIEGDGPIPFPFAFANGIFPPQVMSLGASGALPVATLFLLLVLNRREWLIGTATLFSLALVSLALTAEHIFALLWGGFALATALGMWQRHPKRQTRMWIWILGLSLVLALTTGGVLTELAGRWTSQLAGAPAVSGSGFTGFGLRWPPALLSAHLGSLALYSPGQILIALAELGLALFLGPWVTWWAWQRLRRGDWLTAGLGAAALAGFLLPLVIRYLERDRDITRLTGAALFLWLVLGFPLVWFAARQGPTWRRAALATGYLLVILGGMALFGVQLAAIPRPGFTYFVARPDAVMSQKYWNQLDPDTQIFDTDPHRAITLFGRTGGKAQQDLYTPFPVWEALDSDPDPVKLVQAGYAYIYFDQDGWKDLTPEQQQAYQENCVVMVAEETAAGGAFRRLFDLRACGSG